MNNQNYEVEVGREIEVKIINTGKMGDGVGKYNGYTVFVVGGKKGEEYKVRIKRTFPTYCFAEIVKDVNNK